MPENLAASSDFNEPRAYQIRLKGHLGSEWTDWFDGLCITLEDNGDTLLTGPIIDQAGLYGLLKKVRDLGLPLISVSPIETGSTTMLPHQRLGGTDQADACDDKPLSPI